MNQEQSGMTDLQEQLLHAYHDGELSRFGRCPAVSPSRDGPPDFDTGPGR